MFSTSIRSILTPPSSCVAPLLLAQGSYFAALPPADDFITAIATTDIGFTYVGSCRRHPVGNIPCIRNPQGSNNAFVVRPDAAWQLLYMQCHQSVFSRREHIQSILLCRDAAQPAHPLHACWRTPPCVCFLFAVRVPDVSTPHAAGMSKKPPMRTWLRL